MARLRGSWISFNQKTVPRLKVFWRASLRESRKTSLKKLWQLFHDRTKMWIESCVWRKSVELLCPRNARLTFSAILSARYFLHWLHLCVILLMSNRLEKQLLPVCGGCVLMMQFLRCRNCGKGRLMKLFARFRGCRVL